MIVGKTSDGKALIDGETVFKLHDESGLPVQVVFEIMKENNMMPDWILYYEYAITIGNWEFTTIMKVFQHTVPLIWGEEFGKEVLKRMHLYFYAWGKHNYRHPLDNAKIISRPL